MAYANFFIATPHIASHLPVQCPAEQSVSHASGVAGKCYLAVPNDLQLYLCQGPNPIHISRQECDAVFVEEHMVDRLRALGLQGKALTTAQVDTLRI